MLRQEEAAGQLLGLLMGLDAIRVLLPVETDPVEQRTSGTTCSVCWWKHVVSDIKFRVASVGHTDCREDISLIHLIHESIHWSLLCLNATTLCAGPIGFLAGVTNFLPGRHSNAAAVISLRGSQVPHVVSPKVLQHLLLQLEMT